MTSHLDLLCVSPLLAVPVVGLAYTLATRGPGWVAALFGLRRNHG